ncbi:MAG: non-homologous end-joining DNA ligase [Gemmatimonadota bacterium]|nr:non-homologous end-joining DNA ligase [Gemmatimonadota bacterium]
MSSTREGGGRGRTRRSDAPSRRRSVLDGHPAPRAQPDWIEPMLATLTEPAEMPKGWVYEPKLDGARALVFLDGPHAVIRSRNRHLLDTRFPEIATAVRRAVQGRAILDGEIVASDPETGVPSFPRLQRRLHRTGPSEALRREVAVELWLFDCLHYEGRDLTGQPWTVRRQMLEEAVTPGGGIRLTPYFDGPFDALFEASCRHGGEGLIAKRSTARYQRGRSRDWLKMKCVREQEFVVGGWTQPKGSRVGIGSLLLGYWDGGDLRYAGKVGTGLDDFTLRMLQREMEHLRRGSSPFAGKIPERNANWAEPELVVQVGYGEWPDGALLRHPRFLGIRRDIAASEVRHERAEPLPAAARRR